MSTTTKAATMTKTDSDRLDRLERALAQLAAGVDWSVQRGGRDNRALRDICAEQDALRAELAGLPGAA